MGNFLCLLQISNQRIRNLILKLSFWPKFKRRILFFKPNIISVYVCYKPHSIFFYVCYRFSIERYESRFYSPVFDGNLKVAHLFLFLLILYSFMLITDFQSNGMKFDFTTQFFLLNLKETYSVQICIKIYRYKYTDKPWK